MHTPPKPSPIVPGTPAGGNLRNAARVIVIGSVMFSFISYWRTAAVVLCDLGSTAYYIGGIVEAAIGPAAPWFILAVMLFSYAVRSVYIESCALFTRGGVYRVVKEAMGGVVAKFAVSALIFDYLLTGPISGVSAGQYLIGLVLDTLKLIDPAWIYDAPTTGAIKAVGSVVLCLAILLYFFLLNIKGIHESSDRALKIMFATTVMIVVILVWAGATLAVKGVATYTTESGEVKTNQLFVPPNFGRKAKVDENNKPLLDEQGQPVLEADSLGFIGRTRLADELRDPSKVNWFSLIGFAGIMIAFGHSVLAMSGEETLAQVYRDVESPKLPNFRRAAMIVFIYSLVFTAGISFLAVLLIPQDVRVAQYADNLISGLAMNMIGPDWARIALNMFVVFVGFLILAGAVNTAIIGSSGVLNRVAEDGILPQWFLKPHPKYGTTYRLLYLIVGFMVVVTLLSRGDVILLGEAYAFGVVWSFVFKAMCMVVLRFTNKQPREYKVPFNIMIGSYEIPLGLIAIALVLGVAAIFNLLTKELATISGLSVTCAFFLLFWITEHLQHRKTGIHGHKHLEQFNQERAGEITVEKLGLEKPFRRLVAIRSTQNLAMLEKALAETDPKTTDVIVMTAKMVQGEGNFDAADTELDPYDQELMSAVVEKAEHVGKHVVPLIVPTNRPLHAIVKTASDLKVQELVVGGSNVWTADDQMDQIMFDWLTLHQGEMAPLTVKILTKDREVHFDLGGGTRIPKPGESNARNVAELRAAGVGIKRVMAVLIDTSEGLDLFQALMTLIDPQVPLSIVMVGDDDGFQGKMQEQAEQVERTVSFSRLPVPHADSIVKQATSERSDLLILALGELPAVIPAWIDEVMRKAPCRISLTAAPNVPQDIIDQRPPAETAIRST
jgi:amino acid transporter